MKNNCKHPFPVQRVEGKYVVCIQCRKELANAQAPLNEVFDKNDYKNSR